MDHWRFVWRLLGGATSGRARRKVYSRLAAVCVKEKTSGRQDHDELKQINENVLLLLLLLVVVVVVVPLFSLCNAFQPRQRAPTTTE